MVCVSDHFLTDLMSLLVLGVPLPREPGAASAESWGSTLSGVGSLLLHLCLSICSPCPRKSPSFLPTTNFPFLEFYYCWSLLSSPAVQRFSL